MLILTFVGVSFEESYASSETPGIHDERYELLDVDSLFYIENNGLVRIHVNLNGHRFKLVTDPTEIRTSKNAFLIPLTGAITINLAPYMLPGETNYMDVDTQGPDGSHANMIIANVLVPDQAVAYTILNLEEIPETLDLFAFPEPFATVNVIEFSIPESRVSGVPVHLAIYDIMGRRVRVLLDDVRYPGRYTLSWDGLGDSGGRVARGRYVCRFVAGNYQKSILLTFVGR